VLQEHAAVRQAVVAAWPPGAAAQQLVAYVVPAENKPELAALLRRHVEQALPAYMTPGMYLLLNALPRLPNGKLDRLALPAPDAALPSMSSHSDAAPCTETECTMQAIWADLLTLSMDHIGRHGNFFELGGHSLLATRLIHQMKEKFSVSLSLTALLQNPVLSQLAEVIDSERTSSSHEKEPQGMDVLTPDSANRYQPFPLTDIQHAYWLGRQAMFGSAGIATHRYQEFRLSNFDVSRFNDALNRLIQRHDMLRAIVHSDGTQQILEHVPEYRIKQLDLRGQAPQTVASELANVRETLSHQVLDASQWPVFEFRATQLDEACTHLHISMDMLLMDARSSRLLAHELKQLYVDGNAALPPFTLSFRDYVLAEQAMRARSAYQRAQQYWRDRLPGFAPAPELPLALDPHQLQSPRFTRRSGSLNAAQWTQLTARAQHIGVTPSVVLLAAFSCVLANWSSQSRYTLNLTLSDRMPLHPEVNALVGDFTSLILLETHVDPANTFARQAQALQAQLWRDIDHVAFSGVQVLRELAQMHGAQYARMPVVFTSTLTNGDSAPAATQATPHGRSDFFGEAVHGISQTSQVWLDHQVAEKDGELVFDWDALEQIFPEGLLDDMFHAYCGLLEQLVTDDDAWQQPRVNLLPSTCLTVQRAANETDAPVSPALLHALFEQQACSAPERTAVITEDRRLSYGELQARSRQLGAQLQSLGAKPNRLIAVVMEKGWEQVVATLGVLYAGAAYLPLDPGLPAERLHHILDKAEVTIILTQSCVEQRIAWPAAMTRIAVDKQEPHAGDALLQPVALSTEDLAYVIYTSGSTGLPKGVMIDHRGAVNTILDINARFAVTSDDRVLALSSLSFDLSVFDLFGTLAAGAAIVLPAPHAARDPGLWMEMLAREQVSIWNSVPALLNMLVEYVNENANENAGALPPCLRLAMLSGDWIPLALPERLRALLPSAQLISLGGATEASIWSIFYPVMHVMPHWRSVPYGKPLRNQRFYVLDDALHPRPLWVPGQLYIGGIGLAKGYWRDEKKTNASFIRHPHTGERLYKTGDLGRYLPDGNIEFLGREDFQVKIQGYRIELGEIEAALDSCPDVQASVVNVIGERHGEKSLVAYVVPRDGAPLSNDALSDFLSIKLPRYMVPAHYIVLDRLPLSSNGKIDRKALPAPTLCGNTSAYVAPRTPTEEALAAIWADLLELDRVGIHDNFTELGGHSLDTIKMFQAMKTRLNATLPLAAVFGASTLAALAALVDKKSDAESLLVPLAADGAAPFLFCIHPVGGQTHVYQELAQKLKGEFRVYGIQSPEVAGLSSSFDSLQAMAQAYCAALKTMQPAGPYRLLGWSTGGVIAMAIAAALEEQGDEVQYVGLLDTVPMAAHPETGAESRLRDAALATLATMRGNAFSPDELTGMERALHERDLSITDLFRQENQPFAIDHLEKWTGSAVTPDMLEHLRFVVNTTRHHLTLLAQFAPGTVKLPLHMCHASEALREVTAFNHVHDEANHAEQGKWIKPNTVEGNHYTMLKNPHVHHLAQTISAVMQRSSSPVTSNDRIIESLAP
ncbi:MAG TPA: amino acid adenylation domain-containing protein, partial [Noviherbaspirillum sp.]|nr:amino acid adenylation domain-containing protein [Noviherbaspirillum sp.]